MRRISLFSVTLLLLLVMALSLGCGGSKAVSTDDSQAVLLAQLQAQLDAELAQRAQAGEKFTATPPSDEGSAAAASWDGGGGVLSWYYYSTGDYDQNSETSAADLVPIATNYLSAGPFDPATAQSCVDGDGNSEINSADLVPIAVNFNNVVTGYNVYRSANNTDYPADAADDNGGAELLETVAFTAATGTATERKQFAYTVASPQAGDYYWVRPTDGAAEGTPSNLVDSSGGAPPEINVPVQLLDDFTLAPGSGGINGPYVVNGKPAFLITDGDGLNGNPMYFVQATDETGSAWSTPVKLADLGEGTPALAIVDGNPAVAYGEHIGAVYLYYRRANDADGATWGDPVPVDTSNPGAGSWNSMLVVDGMPAIAYSRDGGGGDEDTLNYVRATDAQGTAWNAPIVLDPEHLDFTRAADPQMVVIDGRPAIAYLYLGRDLGGGVYQDGIRYVMAEDATGDTWQAPLDIYAMDNPSGYLANLNLLDMGGVAGVGWFVEDWGTPANSTVFFRVASNADGTAWGANQVVDSGAGGTSSVSKAMRAAGDEIKYASFATIDLGTSRKACCGITKIFADGREGADMKLLDLEPGMLDWEQYATTLALGFDAGAEASSIRQGGSKQVSCDGSMGFFGFFFWFFPIPLGSHSVSADANCYIYALVAEYNFKTSAIDVMFAAQELPASMFP